VLRAPTEREGADFFGDWKRQKPLSQRMDTVSHSDRYLRYRVPDLICEGSLFVGIENSPRKGVLRSKNQKQVGTAVDFHRKSP
jgi:hypothetical protein